MIFSYFFYGYLVSKCCLHTFVKAVHTPSRTYVPSLPRSYKQIHFYGYLVSLSVKAVYISSHMYTPFTYAPLSYILLYCTYISLIYTPLLLYIQVRSYILDALWGFTLSYICALLINIPLSFILLSHIHTTLLYTGALDVLCGFHFRCSWVGDLPLHYSAHTPWQSRY